MRLPIIIFFFFISQVSFSQTKSLPPEVITAVNQRIESGTNPSIVIGLIDKDGPRYYSFGKKKKGGKKVNEHSVYEIGSISKVFTGLLLADKVIKGELETDDPIENFLPSTLKVPTYEGQSITLGNLSDHTSSLPRLPNNFSPADLNNPYADYSVEDMYAFLSSYEPERPIGSEYEYSNLAVGLLGHILALQSGKSYEDLLLSTIAVPLNMNETKITLTKKMKKNLATGHQQGVAVANWDLPTIAGAGGIRSTAHDMLIFLAANLQLFDHPLKKAMMLSHLPRHDKAGKVRVGLGWHISEGTDGDVLWHNGATGGYTAFTGFIKEKELGVVVLTNSTENVDDIGIHLLDPNQQLRNVVPHIAVRLKEMIDQDGPVDLEKKFEEVKKSQPDKYDYSEDGINTLGYYYLNRKKFNEAIAVFLLNISEYPGSSNVYDSYAEALMESGQKELAIVNYKRSLEINPGNTNAVSMLAKMGVEMEIPIPAVSPSILESYVGTYELIPGFEIVITHVNGQLIAQATGQNAFPVFPKNENEFYYKVVDAQLVFNKDKDGKIESLTLHQNGREMVGKKK